MISVFRIRVLTVLNLHPDKLDPAGLSQNSSGLAHFGIVTIFAELGRSLLNHTADWLDI